ncbi:EAL domain-containing protein [Alteromonas sediminis]|uniref:EAL domain-containing protein n=1 Tax=Alteromonas sediminis TaxID=2259342 RepID=A0A3N5Z4B2_9ALTE|nr:EAL domain-containing protein [Alteromonas sediminis]RPJ64824.1 EAL domain-containing protein [Alteromonas sediminis]
MFAYVARQPIFDVNKEVFAYELLFRDGKSNCFPDIEPDEATSKIIADSHLSFGIEEITNGKLAFINFHQNTLLYRFPTSLDPKTTIVEIVETVNVDPELIKACKHIRGLGYKLALDDYDGSGQWDAFLPFTSIIKFEVDAFDDVLMESMVSDLKSKRTQLVIERVETMEQFERYKAMGFDYFQGYFLARPEIIRHKKIGASTLAMMDLLSETAVSPLNFEKINGIFERDAALTYKLLRFINNPIFDKSHKITSLRHAFNYMGEIELKKFIALLALANLSESEPQELMVMSLVRAKFCEITMKFVSQGEDTIAGFLTGLLSLMDTLTGQEMTTIIGKIPIDQSVKNALCGEDGELKDCLMFVKAFENAHWNSVKSIASPYPIKQTQLHAIYIESVKWANALSQTD